MDFRDQTMSVEFPDGTQITEGRSGITEVETSGISRFSFNAPHRELEFTLPGDQIVTVEIGAGGATDFPPPGVPVVYLDQLHWVSMARHEWAPEKLTEEQRDAVGRLIAHAREKRIILPLAAAHMTETMPTDGRWRRHLAGTMLEFSRGWVMRNPVRVRHEEIRASLEGREPVARGVFTLQPWELFTEDLSRTAPPETAVPGWDEVFPRLTAVSAIYSSMISDEKVDLSDGLTRASAWATSHNDLAKFLRADRASRERGVAVARARLLADLGTELAHAARQSGIDPEAFAAWLAGPSQSAIRAMPYLGRLEQLLVHRLRNADDKWESNDLNDMNFLGCAAGYADLVVGEKKTTAYLHRADKTLGRRAIVCRTLTEAIDHLDELLLLGNRGDRSEPGARVRNG
jgi:hypothetical protein